MKLGEIKIGWKTKKFYYKPASAYTILWFLKKILLHRLFTNKSLGFIFSLKIPKNVFIHSRQILCFMKKNSNTTLICTTYFKNFNRLKFHGIFQISMNAILTFSATFFSNIYSYFACHDAIIISWLNCQIFATLGYIKFQIVHTYIRHSRLIFSSF